MTQKSLIEFDDNKSTVTESSLTTEDIMDYIGKAKKRLDDIQNDWFNKLAEQNNIDNSDEYMLLMDYPTAEKYGVVDHPRVKTSRYIDSPVFVRKDLFDGPFKYTPSEPDMNAMFELETEYKKLLSKVKMQDSIIKGIICP